MPRKTAVQEADAMLPKEVRKGIQDTRRRMDENFEVEQAIRESKDLMEQKRRDRELVSRVIDDVTKEQMFRKDKNREIPLEESDDNQEAA